MDELSHIVSLLHAFEIEPKPLDRLVGSYFQSHPELSSSRRRLIADMVFGVIRWKSRLDGWIVGFLGKKPDHEKRALCFLLWKPPPDADRFPIQELAWKNGLPSVFPDGDSSDFPGGEAAYYSMPEFFWEMMVNSFGIERTRCMAEAFNTPARPILRVNTLKCSRDEAISMLMGSGILGIPTPFSPFGIALEKRPPLFSLPSYRMGMIELQDEAGQLSVMAAHPKPGERVLDFCAGAGGKSLMMAMLMHNQGVIRANLSTAASHRAQGAGS